jgi:hypothetical protein
MSYKMTDPAVMLHEDATNTAAGEGLLLAHLWKIVEG